MNRIIGVVMLLAVMYGLLFWSDPQNATKWSNLKDVLNQQAFFGVLTIGVGVLILTGGIDLSIGSVVGFSAVLFGVLMRNGLSPIAAMAAVLVCGVVIGLINAALVTGLKLQPFLVTLCGLFVYRGAARLLSPGVPVGIQQTRYGLRDDKFKELTDAGIDRETATQSAAEYARQFEDSIQSLRQALVGKDLTGELGFPMQVVVLLVVAVLVGVVLHASAYGRYWYAIGHNEQAARYSGININRHKFAVYVLCSVLASLGGVLSLLDYSSATPESMGETWELYAITGAVLGGCSLRGGEGTVWGMVLGAAVLPLLRNLISFAGTLPWVMALIPRIDPVIPVVVGLTLLLGTIVDELFRRRATAGR